jgi:hypothetical protein
MAAALPSASFSSSRLTRLLADLSTVDVAVPAGAPPTLAERLGGWLNWTDAIALSAALNAGMAAAPSGGDPVGQPAPDRLFDDCARLRAALVLGLTVGVPHAAGAARPPLPGAAPSPDIDFSPYRRVYLAHQRAMASGIAGQRFKLRAALAGQSPEWARLAALDAALEAALRPQERQLLATVPDRLEGHFERLRQAQAAQWLARFAADMQAVLLAELALRWQAIEGLLETLRLELETAERP